jgi:hypothetical protein
MFFNIKLPFTNVEEYCDSNNLHFEKKAPVNVKFTGRKALL